MEHTLFGILLSFPMQLIFWLQVKHLIIDFPLQGPYQYLNKGKYGHPGGILHSGLHAAGTFAVVWIVASLTTPLTGWTWVALLVALFDYLIHYHTDWAKMNLNKKMGWGPTTHEQFWWFLGVDQFIHQITYWFIVAFVLLAGAL